MRFCYIILLLIITATVTAQSRSDATKPLWLRSLPETKNNTIIYVTHSAIAKDLETARRLCLEDLASNSGMRNGIQDIPGESTDLLGDDQGKFPLPGSPDHGRLFLGVACGAYDHGQGMLHGKSDQLGRRAVMGKVHDAVDPGNILLLCFVKALDTDAVIAVKTGIYAQHDLGTPAGSGSQLCDLPPHVTVHANQHDFHFCLYPLVFI